MCRNYLRSQTKTSKSIRDPFNRNLKGSPPGGVTRTEIGNLLENFKTDILGTLGSQLDTLKAKKRQEEENVAFSIFCPKCRRKHRARECPLNNILVCQIFPDEHETDNCPLLPGLQEIYKSGENGKTSYPSRRPWQPRGQPSYQDPNTILINAHNNGTFQIGKTGHLSIPRSMLNTSSGLRVGRDRLPPSFLQFPCPIANIPNLHLMSNNYCQDMLLHLFHLFLRSHNTSKMLPLRDLQYF